MLWVFFAATHLPPPKTAAVGSVEIVSGKYVITFKGTLELTRPEIVNNKDERVQEMIIGGSIPSIPDGAPFDFAFPNLDTIKITSQSLGILPNKSFQNLNKLIKFDFSSSKVEIIGTEAFSNCINFSQILFPNTVRTINSSVFTKCNFTSFIVPSSVTRLDNYVFDSCSILESVRFSEFQSSSSGFSIFVQGVICLNCPNLHSVFLSKYVNLIGFDNHFYICAGCSSLQTIEVDINNPNFSSDIQGILFNKDQSIVYQIPTGRSSITLPNTVRNLSNSCGVQLKCKTFSFNEGLDSIGFYSLGDGQIENIVLPNSLRFLDTECFIRVKAKRITLGSGLKSIGATAFGGIVTLKTIRIPKQVEFIKDMAFNYCTSLETLVFEEGTKVQIGRMAFIGCNMSCISIPDGICQIGDQAFQQSRNFTTIIYHGTQRITGAIFGTSYIKEIYVPIGYDGHSFGDAKNYDGNSLIVEPKSNLPSFCPKGRPIFTNKIKEILCHRKDYLVATFLFLNVRI